MYAKRKTPFIVAALIIVSTVLSACALPGGTPAAAPGQPVVAVGDCHDNSTTSLGERSPLLVNGAQTSVEVRDQSCVRALYHTETGVGKGAQYLLDVPESWSLALAAVSCQVAEDGKTPVDYTNGPFIIIQGPWKGSVGCYEAGLHGVPSEWEYFLTQVILPIHRNEVGNQAIQPIYLSGQ